MNHWLKDVYGGDLPPFEVNEDTIRILKQIFDKNKSSEAGLSIVLEEIREKSAEYQTETDRLRKILNSLYFSPDKLPASLNELIASLASLAVILRSRDPRLPSLSLLLSQHMISVKDADLSDAFPSDRINLSVLDRIAAVDREMSELRIKTESVRENSAREKESQPRKQSEMIFLQKKRQEYVDSRIELEQELAASAFREEVSHSNVSSFRKEISNMNGLLSELQKRKHYYNALPLNTTLAKVKLEEAKLELERLNQEIMTKLNLAH